jgi:hypothetical protein
MKTPYEWEQEALNTPGFLTSDYRISWEFIEAIQRDALSDPMVQTTDQQELEMAEQIAFNHRILVDELRDELSKMRAKWHETRRYLRQANKGAERNNMVMRLQAETIHNLLFKLKKP